MARKHYSDEFKQKFFDLFLKYRDHDSEPSVRGAFEMAKKEYSASGSELPAPGWDTFKNWYIARMRPPKKGGDPTQKTEAPPTVAPVETSAPATAPESAPEPAAEPSDIVERMKVMLRLYRRRSEADIDTVCDRLVPELFEEA